MSAALGGGYEIAHRPQTGPARHACRDRRNRRVLQTFHPANGFLTSCNRTLPPGCARDRRIRTTAAEEHVREQADVASETVGREDDHVSQPRLWSVVCLSVAVCLR